MRIGIDIRCLAEGRRTGVEEYTISLLTALFKIDQKNDYILFFNSFRKPKTDLSILLKNKNVSLKHYRFPNKLLNFLFWYCDWPKIDRMIGADVMFLPNIIFGAFSAKTRVILTIHDLSFEYYGEKFSAKRRIWHFFVNPRKLCERAAAIVTVSDSTRNDLREIYGIREEKINLIYSAVSDEFKPISRNSPELLEIKEKYKLPYKFILYLGTIEPRKNIVGIIDAFGRLKLENDPQTSVYKLVICGAEGWMHKEIMESLEKSAFRNDICFRGYVEEKDKAGIYNLASIFIYPSFFEGFGFPPLEAMKCGLPVVASNNSSLPEIVGRAGILVDPHRTEDLYQAMRQILSDKNMMEALGRRSLEQAARFSWKKAAREFLDLLNRF